MCYTLRYSGCTISWYFKIQTEVALSTTEVEHAALLSALRDTISMMDILEEAVKKGVTIKLKPPVAHCHILEDDSGAL